ncbi:RNA-binding protein 48 [Protopterus annectens]|uniref:RNA-binding protein 48 n=1 Tax=Protopterus annectens TaxID=7888 RepID=UPI001CFA5223|nr:RNA-binding protein 48 [Protopterus annectens]
MATSSCDGTVVYNHHSQGAVSFTRAKYREGRRPRAVKVYTVNLESRYLLIQGVPAVGVMKELVQMFALYGVIEEYRALDEYPAEQFTEVYLLKFQKLQSARVAKRKLDERSFFGGLLHVCYAPEFETVQETREKLIDRRRYIARVTSNRVKQPHNREHQHENAHSVSEFEMPSEPSAPTATETVSIPEWSSHTYCGFPLLPPPPQPQPDARIPKAALSKEGQGQTNKVLPFHHRQGCENPRTGPQETSRVQEMHTDHTKASTPSSQKRTSTVKNVAVARFLPRPTQLQERKRRREEDSNNFFRTNSDTDKTFIGPELPQIPKVDMGDNSLNQSADLIRHTLMKVSSIPLPEQTELQVKPPPKQRRRI